MHRMATTNWRRILGGSGALIATISAAYAFSPKHEDKINQAPGSGQVYPRNYVALLETARPVETLSSQKRRDMLHEAILKSRALCTRVKEEKGLPGLTVGVTVNGKLVWQEGFGMANIETQTAMKPQCIMRIASISKSMTMAMLAQLIEQGKIDIDKPIQTYLPDYPKKFVDGEKVTITTRHLLSHLSGIRHYTKKDAKKEDKRKSLEEMKQDEYFLNKSFASMEEALKLFQDDELFHKPGTKFLYTTHGWTVVSAIIEKLTETKFPTHCKRMFDLWGLKNTMLDVHEPIIYNRASYYQRPGDAEIINAPYVDNSYKWAGGGFLSNVADLTKFANILLYSIQTPESGQPATCSKGLSMTPFLKQSTMKAVWTGNPATARPDFPDVLYALGFYVGEPLRKCVFCKERELMHAFHSGAAIGASSILFMAFPPINKPDQCCDKTVSLNDPEKNNQSEVKGVAVAMITNLTSAGLTATAREIAETFKDLI